MNAQLGRPHIVFELFLELWVPLLCKLDEMFSLQLLISTWVEDYPLEVLTSLHGGSKLCCKMP